ISFPAAGGSYNATGWAGAITGTTTDDASGVYQVQVSILDSATGKYWNGTGFSSSTEFFLTANLASPGATSTTWSVPFSSSNFPADGSFSVHAITTDVVGNADATGLTATFKYDTAAPVTTATLSGTVGNASWYRGPVTVSLSVNDLTSGVVAV